MPLSQEPIQQLSKIGAHNYLQNHQMNEKLNAGETIVKRKGKPLGEEIKTKNIHNFKKEEKQD